MKSQGGKGDDATNAWMKVLDDLTELSNRLHKANVEILMRVTYSLDTRIDISCWRPSSPALRGARRQDRLL